MAFSDIAGFSPFIVFGVWWLLLPRSVLRFYGWFHRGKVALPGTRDIRIAGVIWLLLTAVMLAGAMHDRRMGHH